MRVLLNWVRKGGLLGLLLWCVLTSVVHAQTTVRNIASIAPPAGFTNTNTGGSCTVAGVCSSEDRDAVAPSADIRITKTSATPNLAIGATATFTVVVANDGPSPVIGARISDVVPANFSAVNVQVLSGSVTTAPVSSNTVNGTVSLSAGGSATLQVTAVAVSQGAYTNTASVTPPDGLTDPNPNNNSASQAGAVVVADVTT